MAQCGRLIRLNILELLTLRVTRLKVPNIKTHYIGSAYRRVIGSAETCHDRQQEIDLLPKRSSEDGSFGSVVFQGRILPAVLERVCPSKTRPRLPVTAVVAAPQ